MILVAPLAPLFHVLSLLEQVLNPVVYQLKTTFHGLQAFLSCAHCFPCLNHLVPGAVHKAHQFVCLPQVWMVRLTWGCFAVGPDMSSVSPLFMPTTALPLYGMLSTLGLSSWVMVAPGRGIWQGLLSMMGWLHTGCSCRIGLGSGAITMGFAFTAGFGFTAWLHFWVAGTFFAVLASKSDHKSRQRRHTYSRQWLTGMSSCHSCIGHRGACQFHNKSTLIALGTWPTGNGMVYKLSMGTNS